MLFWFVCSWRYSILWGLSEFMCSAVHLSCKMFIVILLTLDFRLLLHIRLLSITSRWLFQCHINTIPATHLDFPTFSITLIIHMYLYWYWYWYLCVLKRIRFYYFLLASLCFRIATCKCTKYRFDDKNAEKNSQFRSISYWIGTKKDSKESVEHE